jgi:DNA-binding MarR family transcriptional regulator
MQKAQIQLNDDERKVLLTLARSGAMSPSQVSAETWILPGDTLALLKTLADEDLVVMRDDPDTADGKLVALTARARDLLDMGSARAMRQTKR